MIEYIQQSLFDSDCELLAHGCNCRGGFGSGVAGQIAKRYPEAREAYLTKYKEGGWKLGEIQVVQVEPQRWIANCATQDEYGPARPGKIFADYEAIGVVMQSLLQQARENKWRVAIPKIGAGLGGGDWQKISGIIDSMFVDEVIRVYSID